ncbi:uncharacterized protein TRAVEDRAFT_67611 [Trametes versicolor FP-101664 SS1]|uniref:Uncharacterized protein n=1 Tax=Trametes versicolor (strain FP-101664) TaxID=717944 RepID=R7SA35_TRAVS|nr:uncharacterized protein TRAVEDRAFT_67611 [Trametes versicolor FP-101664 SS1]EIW51819.1 hypothetical protein TRAVEDRAFT_67611 [Trametes versicolor FP-101664 SS1]
MGRHNTLLVQRASPAAPRTHKQTRFATRTAQHQKPHVLAKPSVPRSPGLRSRLHSANTSRFLQSRSQLSTIREEDEEEEERAHILQDARGARQPLYEDARAGPVRRRDPDEDADMSSWDDESTLVALLQDNTPELDEDDQMLELVQKLKAPMAAQGVALKQYLADTVLPAYSHVKDVHGVLEDKVDLEFGAGLLTFDEVCKKVERIALKDEDEIKAAHAQSQRTVAKTIAALEDAYEQRKQLWSALQEEMDRCASRASTALDALPGDLEQAIAILEKKSKAIEKDNGAASNQKILRGLLEKL